MFLKRRWRLLPDRSQLVLLAGVLIVLGAAISFINLAIARSAVQTELRGLQAQAAQMEEQNQRLKDGLGRAQRGENIGPKALEYYGMVLPGTIVVEPAVPSPEKQDSGPSGPPFWAEWWKRLIKP